MTSPPRPLPRAELHLNRRVGAVYGVLGLALLVLALVIPVSELAGGSPLRALVSFPLLAVLAVVFGRLARPMLRTRLVADPAGLRGRAPGGQLLHLGWPDVVIDGDAGTLTLELGTETLRLTDGGWSGLGDFLELVTRTPAAAARLTPAARSELAQRLARASERRGRPTPGLGQADQAPGLGPTE